MPLYDLIEQQPAVIFPLRGGGVIFGDEVNASDLAKNRISPQTADKETIHTNNTLKR